MRPRGRSQFNRPQRDMTLTNERIRFPQVRVIDDDNQQLGLMTSREALEVARERGMDLICIAAQAQPPVCRVMDYGKYKYEKSKKEKKAKVAANDLKMVRLHPPTGDHDRAILVRHSERFLREGHKVRVVCQFRRRENAYPELGRQQLDKVADALKEIASVEGQIIKQGRDMTMMLSPRPGVKPLPKVAKGDKQAPDAKTDDELREEAEFAAMQQRIADEADEPDAEDVAAEADAEISDDADVSAEADDVADDADISATEDGVAEADAADAMDMEAPDTTEAAADESGSTETQ